MRALGVKDIAITIGAGAAVVGAVLVASPAARADDLPTLPVPPFDLLIGTTFTPTGTPGVPTDVEKFSIPLFGIPLYESLQQNNSYTVPDGSFETHFAEQTFGGGRGFPYVGDQFPPASTEIPTLTEATEKVTASDGAAPAVGTEWDNSVFKVPDPLGFGMTGLMSNSSLTTPAGTVDVFTLLGLKNEFYDGPAGIIDYLGSEGNSASFVPIIDIPADASSAAASDSWSDLLATL